MINAIKRFLSEALDELCSELDAEKETILCGFDSTEYDVCDTYKKAFFISVLGKTLYVYLNPCERYYGHHDEVLCEAVDNFGYIISRYLILYKGSDDFLFYNETLLKKITARELAREVQKYIQREILNRFSSVVGVDFEDLLQLSDMYYESDSANGAISFVIKETSGAQGVSSRYGIIPDDKILVKFSEDNAVEFSSRNLNYIRKLLAGTGANNALLAVYDNGIFKCHGYVERDASLPCTVKFERNSSILFSHFSTDVFRIKDRKVACLQDKMRIYLSDLRAELNFEKDGNIEKIISKIIEQKHGTSIIFMDMKNKTCNERMDNLTRCLRAVRVDKIKETIWDNGFLVELTRVDGATIIDINGSSSNLIAYINVIVDGEAKFLGDNSLGARHNSILCFIDSILDIDPTAKISALIISESGSFKIIRGSERAQEINAHRQNLQK